MLARDQNKSVSACFVKMDMSILLILFYPRLKSEKNCRLKSTKNVPCYLLTLYCVVFCVFIPLTLEDEINFVFCFFFLYEASMMESGDNEISACQDMSYICHQSQQCWEEIFSSLGQNNTESKIMVGWWECAFTALCNLASINSQVSNRGNHPS